MKGQEPMAAHLVAQLDFEINATHPRLEALVEIDVRRPKIDTSKSERLQIHAGNGGGHATSSSRGEYQSPPIAPAATALPGPAVLDARLTTLADSPLH